MEVYDGVRVIISLSFIIVKKKRITDKWFKELVYWEPHLDEI